MNHPFIIRPVEDGDAAEWLRMRMALWSDTDEAEQAGEIQSFLASSPPIPSPTLHAAFVCPSLQGGLCGLVEVSIRAYADGCETNNVGYLEGWYVDPAYRSRGIGRALVMAAEDWAREQGCLEMASDCELDNIISQAVHHKSGYQETGRVVQFCKSLV
jgi:aminoglycoside 6'-N-acetyltransferase I